VGVTVPRRLDQFNPNTPITTPFYLYPLLTNCLTLVINGRRRPSSQFLRRQRAVLSN
jgi:hypothetical protein